MRTLLLAIVLLAPAAACAGLPAEVEVYDRTAGRVLPVHWHRGQRHVAGEPGHEYEIRIRNRSGGRILAVTSVDGVNVLDGRDAAAGQGGYVLDPWSSVGIEGWRKSLREVAAFYFTALPDSYAARTGRPGNVGVIGVALWRERPQPEPVAMAQRAGDAADSRTTREREQAAPAAAPAEKLGTGHGRRVDSRARWTHFERDGERPAAIIRIYYDSARNLVAQGVIPKPRYARRAPEPFPGGFVPDP